MKPKLINMTEDELTTLRDEAVLALEEKDTANVIRIKDHLYETFNHRRSGITPNISVYDNENNITYIIEYLGEKITHKDKERRATVVAVSYATLNHFITHYDIYKKEISKRITLNEEFIKIFGKR